MKKAVAVPSSLRRRRTMRPKQVLLLGLAVLLPSLAAPAAAAIDGASERHPIAAYDAASNALVAWEDDRAGIAGRFFGADGSARAGALTLVHNQIPSTLPYKAQVTIAREPSIAFLPSGQFFLFWTEETTLEEADLFFVQDTLIDHDVFGQLFSAAGTPSGDRFRVHANTAGFQGGARAFVRSGDLVVAWQTSRTPVFPTNGAPDGVFVRSFDFSGHATSAEIRVSPAGTRSGSPALSGGKSGKVLVAFEGSDGNGRGIFAQALSAGLAPIGAIARVNTDTNLDQRRPAV